MSVIHSSNTLCIWSLHDAAKTNKYRFCEGYIKCAMPTTNMVNFVNAITGTMGLSVGCNCCMKE